MAACFGILHTISYPVLGQNVFALNFT